MYEINHFFGELGLWQLIQNRNDGFRFKTNWHSGIQRMRGQIVLMHWFWPINQVPIDNKCLIIQKINTWAVIKIVFGLKNWYLQTGSAMAMRKSYACLYKGEKVSRKIRPSAQAHKGRLMWSGFSSNLVKSLFFPSPLINQCQSQFTQLNQNPTFLNL